MEPSQIVSELDEEEETYASFATVRLIIRIMQILARPNDVLLDNAGFLVINHYRVLFDRCKRSRVDRMCDYYH